jgi:hypothetical protein
MISLQRDATRMSPGKMLLSEPRLVLSLTALLYSKKIGGRSGHTDGDNTRTLREGINRLINQSINLTSQWKTQP